MPPKQPLPPTYKERPLTQLDAIGSDDVAVLEASGIEYVDSHRHHRSGRGVGTQRPRTADAADGPAAQMQRMDLLRRLRDRKPRFLLLFPHPTPETAQNLRAGQELLERRLLRERTWQDCSVAQYTAPGGETPAGVGETTARSDKPTAG